MKSKILKLSKQHMLTTLWIGCFYIVFHQFRQAKFASGGSILSFIQFLLLPQLPQKNEALLKSDFKKLSR